MEKKPYSITLLRGSQSDTIEIKGILIINHIESIHKELMNQINFSKRIDLKINAESIDLTFIQLILSLKKEFLEKNMDLIIQMNLPEDQQLLIQNAGFDKRFFN